MTINSRVAAISTAILLAIAIHEPEAIAKSINSTTENNLKSLVTDVELAHGYGVTINFIPSGEKIVKIWVDNPSFIIIGVNGCLNNLSMPKCPKEGANLIHIRRIQDIRLPNFPKTDKTLMTIVTSSEKGSNLYLFEIKKVDKVSSRNLVINITE